jgi:hypothetical protein
MMAVSVGGRIFQHMIMHPDLSGVFMDPCGEGGFDRLSRGEKSGFAATGYGCFSEGPPARVNIKKGGPPHPVRVAIFPGRRACQKRS